MMARGIAYTLRLANANIIYTYLTISPLNWNNNDYIF